MPAPRREPTLKEFCMMLNISAGKLSSRLKLNDSDNPPVKSTKASLTCPD